MCGLLAYIGKEEFSLRKTKELLSLMKNRGPDNQSYKKINIFIYSHLF